MNVIYVLRSHGNESGRNCTQHWQQQNDKLYSDIAIEGPIQICMPSFPISPPLPLSDWVHLVGNAFRGTSLSWNFYFSSSSCDSVFRVLCAEDVTRRKFFLNLESKDGKRQPPPQVCCWTNVVLEKWTEQQSATIARVRFNMLWCTVQSCLRLWHNLIVYKTLRKRGLHGTLHNPNCIRVKYMQIKKEMKLQNMVSLSRATISTTASLRCFFSELFLSAHNSHEFICVETATGRQVQINNWIRWKMK